MNGNLNSALTGFSTIFWLYFQNMYLPTFPNPTVITWSSHSHISAASSLVSLNMSSLPTSLLIIPQGLCTGCSFCLEYSSPNSCISLFQVCAQMSPHWLFSDNPFKNCKFSPLPLISPSFLIILPGTSHYLTHSITYLFLFVVHSSPQKDQLHESKVLCLSCSLLLLQHRGQCLAPRRCSVYIYWVNNSKAIILSTAGTGPPLTGFLSIRISHLWQHLL